MNESLVRLYELFFRCKLEAMLAANDWRTRGGEAPAYTEESFIYLAEDLDKLIHEVKGTT